MWIDQDTRLLYAACANSYSRSQWPTYAFLLGLNENLCSHLYPAVFYDSIPQDRGAIIFGARDRRARRRRTFWPAYILKTAGYKGLTSSAETLDIHGFDVKALNDSRLSFWIVNHRPPVDEKNIVLDANKLGANSTIEVFEVSRGSSEIIHVSTISNEVIATPKKVAAVGDGGVLISNDYNIKSECLIILKALTALC